MAELTVLSMTDRVHIDSRRLGEIVDELGETAAHTVLTLALEQLAQGLEVLRTAAAGGDAAELAMRAEMLARLAWQVGLTSLAGVAVDVAICAERQDDTGLAATLGRLMRIGNRSLTEIWDDEPGLG